ncbi:MAG: glycosyltransferase family 2 protein [Caulobacteraceae bacterium]
MPAVTIAIVAYQSGAFLQGCVDALANQTFGDFEVVVADNASSDGSIENLRLPDARFRVEPMGANLGFAAANNRVAFASEAPWFAVINPDAQADADWLAALLIAAARWPGAASFGCTQLSLDDPTRLDGVGDVWHAAGVAWRARNGWSAQDIPPEGEVFGPCGAAALYRRELFVGLGGFDERYFCYCEDVDLAYRLRLAGWTSVQCPGAVVLHAGSGISGRVSEFTLFHGHRNLIWTFAKNTPAAWLWFLIPWRIAYGLALIWAARKVGGARFVARGQWAALKGLRPILASRHEVQRGRRATLGQLSRAMAWSPLAPKRRDIVRIK